MMKINPLYKGGLLMILAGLVIKITALILDAPNSFFVGMAFGVVGVSMIGYSIYKDKKIIIP